MIPTEGATGILVVPFQLFKDEMAIDERAI